jgi:hypothetical protein
MEAYFEGNMLFSVDMNTQGELTIMFDDAENAEFEITTFRLLIDRCESELKAWRARLVEPGSVWGEA